MSNYLLDVIAEFDIKKYKSKSTKTRLTKKQILEIRSFSPEITDTILSHRYKVNRHYIGRIRRGQERGNVGGKVIRRLRVYGGSPGEFRKLRYRLELTQKELAKLMHVCIYTIVKYETGVCPIPLYRWEKINELVQSKEASSN